MKKGQYDRAKKDFHLGLKIHPKEKSLRLRLCRVFILSHQYDSAMLTLDETLKGLTKKDSSQFFHELTWMEATIHAYKNDFSGVESSLRKIMPDTNSFRYRINLCKIYDETEREVPLMKSSLQLTKYFPDSIQSYLIRSWAYFLNRDFKSSEEDLLLVNKVSRIPNAEVLTRLSFIQNNLLKKEEALVNSELAIHVDPANYFAHANRGFALYLMKDFRNAIDAFNSSIKLNPICDYCYLKRGISFYALENYKNALSDLQKAASLNNKLGEAYMFIGYVDKKSGKIESACKNWRIASRLGDKDIDEEIKIYCK